jgi:hypothetical protein
MRESRSNSQIGNEQAIINVRFKPMYGGQTLLKV